jgi:Amt family ammonium transporter
MSSMFGDKYQGVTCVIDDGDTSWVMVATILVLGMMPSLAFFEAGLLRRKDTLSVLVQIFAGLSLLSVMWILFGYSLTFGPDHGGVIGDFSNGLFIGVGVKDCSKHAPTIPHALFALFQMMFAAISPLLMTGAFAERLKFIPFLIYTILWEILVYYPLAHMLWGGGWLDNETFNVLDFAGGIVIHTSAVSCHINVIYC